MDLTEPQCNLGSEVAIMGCGNIGLLAIQWAKVFGAKKVYAIDIDDKKLEMAKEAGADVLINSLDKPAHEQIMEHTNGQGVDVAIESAGSPSRLHKYLLYLKRVGKLSLWAFHMEMFRLNAFISKK